jgi:hypothetical protein
MFWMLKLGLRYLKCLITECVYVRPGVKIMLGFVLKVLKVIVSLLTFCRRFPFFVDFLVWQLLMCVIFLHSPSYKQQHSKTQEQATEIHTNSNPRTRTPKTTYRHQLRLTGYFHGHIRIILDHGKNVYHYLE